MSRAKRWLFPNSYGYEDPADGNRYGGFRAYTKSPKIARTYFQVRLSENLEANQMYCVSFRYFTERPCPNTRSMALALISRTARRCSPTLGL